MKVKLIAITQPINRLWNQESLIEHSARTCYHSQDKQDTNIRFVENVVKRGHLSVTEHISFTFEISGITRACANQLVRHRRASYSQESTRYCDMANQNVIEPDDIKNDPYCHVVWINTVKAIKKAYAIFRKQDIKKEDARAILPLNLETQLVMTCNTRELMHIINLRTSQKAQKEIREVVSHMLDIAMEYCPSVFCLSETKKGS